MTDWTINPGTPDTGCTCPYLDNGHGRRRDERWTVAEGCPLHWPTGDPVSVRVEDTHG